jgi:tetratricopeptide (TPR) repeat protein
MTKLIQKPLFLIKKSIRRMKILLTFRIAEERVHQQFPISPLLLMNTRDIEDHEKAIQVAQEILIREPDSKKALKILTQSLEKTGRSAQALAVLESYYEGHQRTATVCLDALEIARRCGDYQRVVTWSKRALELDPNCGIAVAALGQYYHGQRNVDRLHEVLRDFVPGMSIRFQAAYKIPFLMLGIGDYIAARSLLNVVRMNHPNDFILLALQITCEISDGRLDEAVALGREMLSSEDDTRRAYFFYQNLVSMIEENDRDKTRYGQDHVVFKARMEELLASPPSQDYIEWLRINRENIFAIRGTRRSLELMREQPIQVSYVCPIHRPEDVQNAIAQISQQSWKNAEAVFAINGGKISAELIEASWQSDLQLKIVDCNGMDRVGPVLNRAIHHSSGDIIIRIDADNMYMPDYAADAVLAIEYYQADVVGQRSGFRFFKDDNLVVAKGLLRIGFTKAKLGDAMGGGTLCFKRELLEDVVFSAKLYQGEDTNFVRQSISEGFSVYFTGPFNYLSVRSDEASEHTWNVSKAEIILLDRSQILGSIAEIKKDVTLPIESQG